jgi:hypothetical protein
MRDPEEFVAFFRKTMQLRGLNLLLGMVQPHGASLDAAGYNRMSADTSIIAHVPPTPFPADEKVAQALNFRDSADMGDGASSVLC